MTHTPRSRVRAAARALSLSLAWIILGCGRPTGDGHPPASPSSAILTDILAADAAATSGDLAVDPRRVFLMDLPLLDALHAAAQDDTEAREAVRHLIMTADKRMTAPLRSVVQKDQTPPSGDKHDYMSLAPYWWPDPARPDGLPYIRRDGERNPEVRSVPDPSAIAGMADDAQLMALAYVFTGDRAYAARAAQIIRTWFLDPATAMNPHMRFAQAVRGIDDGRGYGIIESRVLLRVIDALGLLAPAAAFDAAEEDGLKAWFTAYLAWLRDSDFGRGMEGAVNNHGTWYDAQVVAVALFLGQEGLARDVLARAVDRRLPNHFLPDGSQPEELDRTKPLDYSLFNLEAWTILAQMGRRAGVKVWSAATGDKRSLGKAFDWLGPRLDAEPFDEDLTGRAMPIFHLAGRYLAQSRYRAYAARWGKGTGAEAVLATLRFL